MSFLRRLRRGRPIVVVSGLPRSGTSMAMAMLEAGGLSVLTDGLRAADASNPKGYFEFERVKELDKGGEAAWLADARDQEPRRRDQPRLPARPLSADPRRWFDSGAGRPDQDFARLMERLEAAMLLAVAALLGLVSQVPASLAAATATGRVLDFGTRAPLAKAKVMLLPPAGQRRGAIFVEPIVGLTDADGRFVFTGIAPGEHTVQVTVAGYVGGSAAVTASEPAAGAPAHEPEVLLRRGGVFRGRVVDADGAPVESALVSAQRKVDRGRVGTPVGGALARGVPGPRLVSISGPAQTNAQGEFTIDAVEPGPYYIRATAPYEHGREASPGSGSTTRAIPTYYPGTIEPEAALPVVATAGQPIDVGDIRLQFAAAYRVAGVAVDEAGRPVEHVRVRLVPADASPGALPMAGGVMGRTDANGGFALSAVLHGNYLLVAVPPIVLERDPSPAARGRHASSFVLGGTRPETARGSVATETDDGTTRQFRDELATTVPVDVTLGSLFDVRVVVKRP